MAPLLRRRRGAGGGGPTINQPWPLLIKEGNQAAIFMRGGEPKDHEVCAQDDTLGEFFSTLPSFPGKK
jgi:hypothetical protein